MKLLENIFSVRISNVERVECVHVRLPRRPERDWMKQGVVYC